MKNLMSVDLPEWYSVSFPRISEIEVRIIPEAIAALERFVVGHRLVDGYVETFEFTGFSPFTNGRCGFNNVLKMKTDVGQVLLSAKLPKDIMMPPASGPQYELLDPLLASLDLVFRGLRLFDPMTGDGNRQQFLVNYFSPSKTSRGNCLGVILSRHFVDKIVKNFGIDGQFSFPDVEKVMARFYRRLTGWKDYDSNDFRCSVNDSRLFVVCPGNACDLGPELSYMIDSQGYEMTPHNLDNPAQLITLFFGVMTFCNEITKEK